VNLKFRRQTDTERNSVNLNRRLQAHLVTLVVLLFVLTIILIFAFGLFSPKKAAVDALRSQLERNVQNLNAYFRDTAAQGIHFSRQLSREIEKTLLEEKATFEDVSNNQKLIALLQTNAYPYLYNSLRMADCSGVFVIFDATVNTSLPNAKTSRCGVYLKLANINTSKPINPDVVLARGIHEIGHNNGHIFHNKWELEFDSAKMAFYSMMLENASANLMNSYYYSTAMEFHGTWEKMMLFCVPLVGENGQVYGVYGFEINSIFFKLAHAVTGSTYDRTIGLVAKKSGDLIRLETGLEFGTQEGYFAGLGNNTLSVRDAGEYNYYRLSSPTGGETIEFVGLDRELSLSPLSDKESSSWVTACLVPKEDFTFMVYLNYFKLIMFSGTLLAFALLATYFIRKRNSTPILQGLEAIRRGTKERTYITEIDDLLDFLEENNSAVDVDMPFLNDFEENVKKLSRAETAVFNLYMEGYSAPKIADMLYVSINTIKSHNRNIYRKLNISSRKELLLLAHMKKNANRD